MAETAAAPRARMGYRPALDGFRGIGVMAVFGYHAGWQKGPGTDAVLYVFFSLSGFLITTLLLEEAARRDRLSYPAFLGRRFLRLVPAMATAVGVICLLCLHWPHFDKSRDTLHNAPSFLFYYSNWVQAYGAPHITAYFEQIWSLAVEEQFYLVWGLVMTLVVWRCRPEQRWKWVAAIAAIGALLAPIDRAILYRADNFSRIFHGTDTNADYLLWGCAFAALYYGLPDGDARRARVGRLAGWLALPALVIIIGWIADAGHITNTLGGRFTVSVGLAVIALACAVLILALATVPTFGPLRVFSWKPVVDVGKVSYGLYIWHYPLILMLTDHGPFHRRATLYPAEVIVCGIATVASYFLIEQPFLRLKARLSQRARGINVAAVTLPASETS